MKKWGTGRLDNLPKVTQLVRVRAGNWGQCGLPKSPCSNLLSYTALMSWEILRSHSDPGSLLLPSTFLSATSPHHTGQENLGVLLLTVFATRVICLFRMRLGTLWGLFFVTSLTPLIFGSQFGLIIGVRGNSRFWGMVHTQARQEIWEFFRWSHSWFFKWPFKTGGPWYGSSYAYTHYQGGTAGTVGAEWRKKRLANPWNSHG